jgi:hypothetical protein
MVTANDFSEYYKTISDTELIGILDNSNDYQPLAVVAAKEEFSKRQLSEAEIQIARQPLIANQQQKDKEKEKVKAVETKFKEAGHTFIDVINPIQSGIPSTEKTIRLIVIIFGGTFLYQFIKDFKANLTYVEDFPRFPFESIIYFVPQILLPVATIAFWKRKTIGWRLLTIFLTFSAVGAMWLLFQSFKWKPSGFVGLDNLYPRPSPENYFIQLLFFAGTIYVLCKSNIREVFSIDKNKMGKTIGITGLVTFIFLIANS